MGFKKQLRGQLDVANPSAALFWHLSLHSYFFVVLEVVVMKEHSYTKAQIVEIAFQIYVPKGTKLKDTRKSTWMNPLVGGDEAAMMKLSKKINEDTSLQKVMDFVSATKLGQLEMEDRAITPTLLPEDAKRNGFEPLKERSVRKVSQAKKK